MGVTGEGIEARDRLDFVAEKFNPHCFFIGAGRINFDNIAADTEPAAREIHVIAFIEHVDQTAEHRFSRDMLAAFHRQQHVQVIFR